MTNVFSVPGSLYFSLSWTNRLESNCWTRSLTLQLSMCAVNVKGPVGSVFYIVACSVLIRTSLFLLHASIIVSSALVTARCLHSPLPLMIAWWPAPGDLLDSVAGTGIHQLDFREWHKGPMACVEGWDQSPGRKVEETGTEQQEKGGKRRQRLGGMKRPVESWRWCTRQVTRGRLTLQHWTEVCFLKTLISAVPIRKVYSYKKVGG